MRNKSIEDAEVGEDGFCAIEVEITEEDRSFIYKAFMVSRQFRDCSKAQFEAELILTEDLDKAMASACMNEFIIEALESQIKELKDEGKLKDKDKGEESE